MKHLWFGIGLLVFLLVASIWLGSALEELHRFPAEDLEYAADAALEGNWNLSAALISRAEQSWSSRRNLTAALTHHDAVFQIDKGFDMLKSYIACQDTAGFVSTCAQLAAQLRSVHQPHSFRWWSLL